MTSDIGQCYGAVRATQDWSEKCLRSEVIDPRGPRTALNTAPIDDMTEMIAKSYKFTEISDVFKCTGRKTRVKKREREHSTAGTHQKTLNFRMFWFMKHDS